jgi:hypothetical protein
MSVKNSNDTIGNRTRDLPACSAVPQPTAPPRGPPILWVLGVKQHGREVDHSPPSSTEVKNERSYIPLLLYIFVAWTGEPYF